MSAVKIYLDCIKISGIAFNVPAVKLKKITCLSVSNSFHEIKEVLV